MAIKKTLCRAASGAFVRNIGWKRTASGYSQHKFHLGRDEVKATLANLRVEQLWREVAGRWERYDPKHAFVGAGWQFRNGQWTFGPMR